MLRTRRGTIPSRLARSILDFARTAPLAVGEGPLNSARIGIVTVSDRASSGTYEDLSGPAIRDTLGAFLKSSW
jgi:hypothetical protein